MRMELQKSRLATAKLLAQEWEKRLDTNSDSVDAIANNQALWMQAGGVEVDHLLTPTEMQIAESKRVVEILHRMLEKHGGKGGLDSYVAEMDRAVSQLKVVSWQAIHEEKFSLTPWAVYEQLVENAQQKLSQWNTDYSRREARLQQPSEHTGGGDGTANGASQEDKYTPIPKTQKPDDKYGLEVGVCAL